jgi:hypothetical protein
MTSSLPWWRTDEYKNGHIAVPGIFNELAGPKELALVRVWPDGRTDQGWGLQGKDGGDGFMPRYMRGEFNARRVLYGYDRQKWAFAFIMRSCQLVAIDIDGKNGGLEHAKRLGVLPPTMSETSKSGNGFHLIYRVDEEWDDLTGFGSLNDRIGVEQGVDFRATGCLYHHDTQAWNWREPALLPDHIRDLLMHQQQKVTSTTQRIATILANQDDLEVLMLHDEMRTALAKPIPQGKRNQTLFALGSQMHQGQYPNWEIELADRASAIGLPDAEIEKLVSNIQQYGLSQTVPVP